MLMSSNDAGGHSNKLMVTAVMFFSCCLSASHGSEKGCCKVVMSERQEQLSTCCAICFFFFLFCFARGDLCMNAQGHTDGQLSDNFFLCSFEMRVFVLLSVIETPRSWCPPMWSVRRIREQTVCNDTNPFLPYE